MTCRPPISTLFPYTTLFRSVIHRRAVGERVAIGKWPRLGRGCRSEGEECGGGSERRRGIAAHEATRQDRIEPARTARPDRKSTRLNSSHVEISYAVFCLKKK